MKHYLTWKEKKAIVDEAYSCEKNIKATARMHNVSPAQPFKDYVKQSYEQFMVENNGRKSTRLDVAKWITSAWEKIKTESICHTWESIGIITNPVQAKDNYS